MQKNLKVQGILEGQRSMCSNTYLGHGKKKQTPASRFIIFVSFTTVSLCQQECPCVEKVQDSALIPVNVERKVTLVGKHLNVFQVTTAIRL